NLEHSTWLNMMYPRLKLLREFMREDGSIWISIDDREGASAEDGNGLERYPALRADDAADGEICSRHLVYMDIGMLDGRTQGRKQVLAHDIGPAECFFDAFAINDEQVFLPAPRD
ncbi:MAG: hypothetical protein II178_11580, partial [Selenomonadaceae bacterium]|nr:hypothetical protein [Selenomonadaceae bacterium]